MVLCLCWPYQTLCLEIRDLTTDSRSRGTAIPDFVREHGVYARPVTAVCIVDDSCCHRSRVHGRCMLMIDVPAPRENARYLMAAP